MIKNNWQLRVTQKRIKDFEDALFELKRLPKNATQPWLRAAQRESLESELRNLCAQVDEYELLKAGKVALPGAEVLQQVPELLIKTRISKGLDQEALAARLGVSKQCIQQYEQTNYAHVTLSALQKIMQALVENSESSTMATGGGALTNKEVRPASAASDRTATAKKTATRKAVTPKRRMNRA